MPGTYQYDVEIKSNVAKLLTDMKEVQDRLDTVEGKEYKIKLNVDEKKLANVISNLEKMLDSLGKGTGDFKQFENLSKELSSITYEVQKLSKAFGKVDDSGTKTLLSSIQSIDKSLSELSQNILNVTKNMSNMGDNINDPAKQIKLVSDAADDAEKKVSKLVETKGKLGNKTNISLGDTSTINSELQAKIDTIKKEKELLSKIRDDNDLGDYGKENSRSEKSYNETINSIKSMNVSYEEVLATVTKIRDLQKEQHDLYGQMNGLDPFSDERANLKSTYDEKSKAIRELESTLPILELFQDETDKVINRSTTNEGLSEFAKEFVQYISQAKLELGQMNDVDFASIIQSTSKIEEPLKEVKANAESATKELQKLGDVYRAVRSQDLEFLDNHQKNGAIWATSQKDLYNTLYTGGNEGKSYSAEYYARNPLVFDAKGQQFGSVTYLGDGSDEVSRKITELYNKIQELTAARDEAYNSIGKESQEYIELSKQLGLAKTQYDELSKSKENVYGTHFTDEYVDLAKANGYDGLRIDNIYDSTGQLSSSFAVWSQDQIKNIQLMASGEKELLAIHNQMKDAFPKTDNSVTDASISAIKEENNALEQTAQSAEKAANSKKKFVDANEKVKASADASVGSVKEEVDALEKVKSFTPNTSGFDEVIKKLGLTEEQAKRVAKIVENTNYSKVDGKSYRSYNITYDNGYKETRGENSKTDRGNILTSSGTIYDVKEKNKEELASREDALNKMRLEEADYLNERERLLEEGKRQAQEVANQEAKDREDALNKMRLEEADYLNERERLLEEGSKQNAIESAKSKLFELAAGDEDLQNSLQNNNWTKRFGSLGRSIENLNQELNNGKINADDYVDSVDKLISSEKKRVDNILSNYKSQEAIIDNLRKVGEEQKKDIVANDWDKAIAINNNFDNIASLPKYKELSSELENVKSRISEYNQQLANGEIILSDYNKKTGDLISSYKEMAKIQQNRDIEEYETNAKEELELEKQLQQEYKKSAQAQQEKWKATQKEQANYEEEQKKAEFIKKQTVAYDELTNTISKYSEVAKRVASGKSEDGDLELMTKLEDKISQLQKQPILSDSQVAKSEKMLLSLYDQLDKIEKKTAETAIKSEWDKNVKAIQDYMDAVTKLNNLKAKDAGSGKYSSQIELQTKNVKELEQTAYEASKVIASFMSGEKINNIPVDSWGDFVDVIKMIEQASNGSAESVAKLKDALKNAEAQAEKTKQSILNGYDTRIDSYNKKISGYDATIARFEDGGWASDTYKQKVDAVKKAVGEYGNILNNLKTHPELATEEELGKLDQKEKLIKENITAIQNMSAAEKGYTKISAQKELDKINNILKEHSGMSKEAKNQIKAYYAQIKSGNPSASLDVIHAKIMEIVNAEVEAGRGGKSMLAAIGEKAWYGVASTIGTFFGLNDILRYGGQAVDTIRDLNSAMTEVKKVSDATEAQYNSFKNTIADTAKEIASTNKELLNSSADFLRLGYNLNQATDLAKNATLFVNVGDGVDITESTEDIITAMKAFDIQAEESIKIVDDYNQIGNMYALSASDIGEAMKRSASALETGNNSFEESIGLITAMNEIVQNSENTGNSLKVLSLRLRGAKAELESAGEDTDGLCDSTSKLREQIQSLTGVDIMIDKNNFKSTAEIIKELGAVWNNLSDTSQAATLEIIAGKSRANNVAALLKNYQQIDNVIKDLGDAEGSAVRENEAILDSIDGRIKILSATAEKFWQTVINEDAVKDAVTLASNLLDVVTNIVDTAGVLPTILTTAMGAMSVAGYGKRTIVSNTTVVNLYCAHPSKVA